MTGFDQMVALIAIIPAALNPSLSVEQEVMKGQICGGEQAISIPLGAPNLPGTLPSACCAKGCHSKRRDNTN